MGTVVLLQLQLLAVDALGEAVEAVILTVEDDLHEGASGAVEGLGIVVAVGDAVVGVPNVGTEPVAHACGVDIHGIENPVIVAAHAEEADVGLLLR